jgi:predicted  nucleic acid-binding Zn-ribbon protein
MIVPAYSLCRCGHWYERHRPANGVLEGCNDCTGCHGFVPCGGVVTPTSDSLGPNLTERDLDARLEGFADAEGLVLAMLADMAAREQDKHAEAVKWWESAVSPIDKTAWRVEVYKRHDRAQVLGELELALHLGQHRTVEHGDPDLGRKLERAHQKMANSAEKGRRGGEKTSGGLTRDERVKKTKLAAEARWSGRRKQGKGID